MTVPSPLAVDGETTHDPATNSLLVKVSGVGARFWRRGHAALLKAEGSGSYWSAPPVVSASAPGRREIARGEPVGGGWLRFKLSDADYRRLAGRQDLRAIVTVDTGADRILGVKFRHRDNNLAVPFLTNGRFFTDPEQLRWYVPLHRIPSPPPVRASAPVKPASTEVISPRGKEPPTALVEPPGGYLNQVEITSEGEPVWLIRIDIDAWRRRGWMWRLAASIVIRRLRR